MNKMAIKHLGIIMDGNRRWAQKRGLSHQKGHQAGFQTLKRLADKVLELEIEYLSIYAFSTENWSRSQAEINWLMRFTEEALKSEIDDFNKKDIKLLFVGSRSGLSSKLVKLLAESETKTANNRSGTLAVCFNYGGQEEIVAAVKKALKSGITTEDLSIELISKNLYHSDIPPLDLIIRTSGEQRLSNFMLWRAAYAELLFVDKLWPDFTPKDLENCVEAYQKRDRRFGGSSNYS